MLSIPTGFDFGSALLAAASGIVGFLAGHGIIRLFSDERITTVARKTAHTSYLYETDTL